MCRWEDIINTDFWGIGVEEWINLAHNRDMWCALVKAVMRSCPTGS
jgi:hypothetical protein